MLITGPAFNTSGRTGSTFPGELPRPLYTVHEPIDTLVPDPPPCDLKSRSRSYRLKKADPESVLLSIEPRTGTVTLIATRVSVTPPIRYDPVVWALRIS